MIYKIFYSIIAVALCGIVLYCIWTHNINFYKWMMDKKLLMATVIFIAIVAISFWCYRTNFKKLLLFSFSPNKFIENCANDSIRSEMKTNVSFKKACESDEDYKKTQKEKFRKQFTDGTNKLRNSIFRAFVMVLLIFICAFLSAFIMKNYVNITKKWLFIIQIISAFVILWALMGKLGFGIQTFCGDTLPEQVNNFWFIFLNVIGIYFLFFTYFFNLFRDN